MNRKLIFIGILTFLFIALISETRNINIHQQFSCVEYIIGENDFDNVDISLFGKIDKRLFEEDRISYTLYINDNVYPEYSINEFILPYKQIVKVSNGEVAFTPVNEITTFYSKEEKSNFFQIAYEYFDTEKGNFFTRSIGKVHLGFENEVIVVSFFQQDEDGDGYSWSSGKGTKMIVSGNSIEEAALNILKLTDWSTSDY